MVQCGVDCIVRNDGAWLLPGCCLFYIIADCLILYCIAIIERISANAKFSNFTALVFAPNAI